VHHLPVSKDAPINYKLSTVNLTIIFLECLVVVLAVAQFSVDEANELYGCLEAEFLVLGAERRLFLPVEERISLSLA
jgi:hypothetical protein